MESEINYILKSLDTKRTVFLHAEGPLFCFGVNVCKKNLSVFFFFWKNLSNFEALN